MKPNHLLTSMLAITAIAITSCSAPRLAQQSSHDDDVYNSNAQAAIYTPPPVRVQTSQDVYDQNDEYYGTSDPYYDMDYASRINRFNNYSPWRGYYDPYFDNGYYGGYGYNGFSLGLSFGSVWNSPYYGWGNYWSPFYGYNPWGWNSYWNGGWGGPWGGYYGGYYGGGLWGGYYGGGLYTGRTTNAPRPSSMGRDGVRSYGMGYGSRTGGTVRSDMNGNVISRRTRAEMYDPNGEGRSTRAQGYRPDQNQNIRPGRAQGYRPDYQPNNRPTRTEGYRPEPSYNPPSRSGGFDGGGGRSSGGGGGGGGGRSSRGGRG